jgi:hypothetical protein
LKRSEKLMENTDGCHSCEVVNINGVRTHEHGCPDAWRDEVRECRECGSEFEPEERMQVCCDSGCARTFAGLPPGEEYDEGDISDSFDPAPGYYGPDRERASY